MKTALLVLLFSACVPKVNYYMGNLTLEGFRGCYLNPLVSYERVALVDGGLTVGLNLAFEEPDGGWISVMPNSNCGLYLTGTLNPSTP